MKAKVKETGEIIDVKCLYPVTYSRLDGNNKIIEEYDEDEIELIFTKPKVKMVSLDKVCEFLESCRGFILTEKDIEEFCKTMNE